MFEGFYETLFTMMHVLCMSHLNQFARLLKLALYVTSKTSVIKFHKQSRNVVNRHFSMCGLFLLLDHINMGGCGDFCKLFYFFFFLFIFFKPAH